MIGANTFDQTVYSSVIKAPKYRKESLRANQYQFETDICHNQRLHCVHTSHFVLNCSIRKAAKHVRCAKLPWEIKTPVYADIQPFLRGLIYYYANSFRL